MANVIVEEVGPCKKQLKITIPVADVQAKIEDSYKQLSSSAVVDGFRKGHVPRKLLERRFSEEVLEDVKQALLAESTEKGLEDNSLKPLGEPSFDNVEFAADKECTFDVTVEVEPVIELPEYTGLKLTKKTAAVTDEEIGEGLERLRKQRARLELMPEDSAVAADDWIVCDWELACDDETIASENDDQVMARGKRFGEMDLEKDLAEVFEGAKSGEKRTVETTILDSYPIEKWRGKKAVLDITPKEIRRPVLPEMDEEFAKGMDFASVQEMRDVVKQSLEENKAREASMALEQQAFDKLLELCPFELPEGVFKAQARNIMVRQQLRLRQRGVPDEEVEKHVETLRNASEEAAARNLKVFFILNKIAEKEKIFVTENDVQNRIGALANRYRVSTQKMQSQLEADNALGELRSGMREDKVTEFLLSKAEIEEEKA